MIIKQCKIVYLVGQPFFIILSFFLKLERLDLYSSFTDLSILLRIVLNIRANTYLKKF